MSQYLTIYQQYHQHIQTLKHMSTLTITPPKADTQDVLQKVFTFNNVSVSQNDLIVAEEIIKTSQENGYSAFMAATHICNELCIEPRFTRTTIEFALQQHNILN